jgi:hypothetical protein
LFNIQVDDSYGYNLLYRVKLRDAIKWFLFRNLQPSTSVTENVERLYAWEINVVYIEENGEVIRQGSLSMLTYNTSFALGLIPQYVDLVRERTHQKVAITVADVKIIMHDKDLFYRSSEDKISIDPVYWFVDSTLSFEEVVWGRGECCCRSVRQN